MDADQTSEPANDEVTDAVADAPSPRAKALREEIFGSALTLDEAAYILSLDRTTVAKYLRERTLFGFQIGREWLIPEEELRAYVSRVYRTKAARPEDEAAGEEEGAPRPGEALPRAILGKLFPREKEQDRAKRQARFDKFTERARRVLALAQEEAQRFNHNYIGTEHLLLGLIREGEGVAAKVLANLGVDLNRVRSAVEHIIGRGDRPVVGEVGLTPRSKKVIELAVNEARRLNHHYIGTEHLLLGLIREGEGIAAGVLESLGINLERVRTQTIQVLSQSSTPVHMPPVVPDEAVTLIAEDEQGLTCQHCGAKSPAYFRYCFNCGERLEGDG